LKMRKHKPKDGRRRSNGAPTAAMTTTTMEVCVCVSSFILVVDEKIDDAE